MTRRTFTAPMAAVLACAALAGCGDDDGDSGAATTPRTTPATATTPDLSSDAQKSAGDAAEKAAAGDVEGAAREAVKVCREQAKALEGESREAALKLCESAPRDAAGAGINPEAKKAAQEAAQLAQKGDTEGALAKAREACRLQAADLKGESRALAQKLCGEVGKSSGGSPR